MHIVLRLSTVAAVETIDIFDRRPTPSYKGVSRSRLAKSAQPTYNDFQPHLSRACSTTTWVSIYILTRSSVLLFRRWRITSTMAHAPNIQLLWINKTPGSRSLSRSADAERLQILSRAQKNSRYRKHRQSTGHHDKAGRKDLIRSQADDDEGEDSTLLRALPTANSSSAQRVGIRPDQDHAQESRHSILAQRSVVYSPPDCSFSPSPCCSREHPRAARNGGWDPSQHSCVESMRQSSATTSQANKPLYGRSRHIEHPPLCLQPASL